MTFERAVAILKKYNEIRDKINAALDEMKELMTSADFSEVHEYYEDLDFAYGGEDDLDEEQLDALVTLRACIDGFEIHKGD